MKVLRLLFLAFFMSSMAVAESDIPAQPPSACYDGCNDFMNNLLSEFESAAVAPQLEPAVYSGICRHNGMYDSEVDHHGVVLLDQVDGLQRFGGQFSFFAGKNEYAEWTLEKARQEISPGWSRYGKTILEENTLRSEVRYDDGRFAYVYWMRQNPVSKELLVIYYSGTVMRSFCRFQKHP